MKIKICQGGTWCVGPCDCVLGHEVFSLDIYCDPQSNQYAILVSDYEGIDGPL